MTTHKLFSCLALLVMLTGMQTRAGAAITQQISFSFDPTPNVFGTSIVDSDSIQGATAADIDRALIASLSGNGYQADGSVGRFGNFGLRGFTIREGELHAQVQIAADLTAPATGAAREANLRFVIDGGMFGLLAARDSSLEYRLSIRRDFNVVFFSAGALISTDDFRVPQFNQIGDDIGARLDPNNPTIVEVPFSFQTVSLGTLNPGQTVAVEYQLDIIADIRQVAEFANFEFQDPFNVNNPDMNFRPTLQFASTAPVPEPSTCIMWLVLAVVGGLSRRSFGRAIA